MGWFGRWVYWILGDWREINMELGCSPLPGCQWPHSMTLHFRGFRTKPPFATVSKKGATPNMESETVGFWKWFSFFNHIDYIGDFEASFRRRENFPSTGRNGVGFLGSDPTVSTMGRRSWVPSRELRYSTWGKGKSSTQKCLGMGYVSSLEGIWQSS